MATLSKIDRARIILDLIKDGDVVSLADYSDVEQATPALALKYARAAWDAKGFRHPAIENPTNEELATNYLNRIRDYNITLLAASRVTTVGNTARDVEAGIVAAEGTTDLNDAES